jgi:hypothetical protein
MSFNQQRTYFQECIQKVNPTTFDQLAIELFNFQAKYNPLYGEFLTLLNKAPESVSSISQIPFLPISLFKNKTIKTGDWNRETLFESSGTTGQVTSKHEVRSMDWYKKITVDGFNKFYGDPKEFCFLALLPSYIERSGSSLVLMADHFIKQSWYKESGFFLNNHDQLYHRLDFLKKENIPTILLGVSFGLLDFIEKYEIEFPNLIVMETGGMKGRRKEMTRSELHNSMTEGFGVKSIHSEYGMTELFSQAYSKGHGRFQASPTMKVLVRDISDPFYIINKERHGAINIIDLANIDTCAFIATDDLGRQFKDDSFEVLGRLDASDIRGCNLMVGQVIN